jgi:hypothetical protein
MARRGVLMASAEELEAAIDKAILTVLADIETGLGSGSLTAYAHAVKDLANARSWISHPHKRS